MTVFARRIERALAESLTRARHLPADSSQLAARQRRATRRRGWRARRRDDCPACPACPRTQCQRIRCVATSVSSSRHSSAFLTGLRSARQPAVALPLVDPALDALLDVLRIESRDRRRNRASAPRARESRRSAPSGCSSSAARRRRSPSRGRRNAAARPIRPGPGCPCTRRRCRSTTALIGRQRVRRCIVVRPSRARAAGASAFLRARAAPMRASTGACRSPSSSREGSRRRR